MTKEDLREKLKSSYAFLNKQELDEATMQELQSGIEMICKELRKRRENE